MASSKETKLDHQQAVTQASASWVVTKPIPQSHTKDARTYQIDQLKRRFSPKDSVLQGGVTSLVFKMAPSDPDFPFELSHLDCEIRIPPHYPNSDPTLHVRNKDIPRGFAINVEKGWERLVEQKRGATLLALTNALDKNLELFLSEQKTETIKMTIFKDTRHLENSTDDAPSSTMAAVKAEPSNLTTAPPSQPTNRYVPEKSHSKEEISAAQSRRAQEVRQLEARMGKNPLYHKSGDGIVYTLPIEPRRRSELPNGLQTVRSFQLIIPLLYPLQELRVLLNDVESNEAEGAEDLFTEKAQGQKQMTLMSHINYLTQNLHVLSKQASANKDKATTVSSPAKEEKQDDQRMSEHVATVEEAKSHIKFIPRPPEWGYGQDSDGTDEESSYDDETDPDDGGATLNPEESSKPQAVTAQVDRGTALSFPSVQLHGVELLQLSSLSVNIKCSRCKTINDVNNIKPDAEISTSCKKCAAGLAIKFRPEAIHAHSARIGFIDTEACTVADVLPSTFIPTCARCSTPTAQGIVAVRGDTLTNVCRECHARFTLSLPDVRLTAYTPGLPLKSAAAVAPRRQKEKLGLRAGEELPGRGACTHYRKSYRWFRFGCCGKVYPCDHCHDAEEAHVNEWASRMVCGFCSREQRYAPESCTFCGRSVIGRKGKGYWEGGKGTRDRTLMRKGDPRKYRKVGGTEVSGKKKE
jgi:LSD1 subclass zinc finger protein